MVAGDRLSPTRNIQRKGHGMKNINGDSAAGLTNVVALRGTIRGAPTQRQLPSGSVVTQFDVARPEWHKYLTGEVPDAKTAATNAMDAVRAEFKKQTGKDAQ